MAVKYDFEAPKPWTPNEIEWASSSQFAIERPAFLGDDAYRYFVAPGDQYGGSTGFRCLSRIWPGTQEGQRAAWAIQFALPPDHVDQDTWTLLWEAHGPGGVVAPMRLLYRPGGSLRWAFNSGQITSSGLVAGLDEADDEARFMAEHAAYMEMDRLQREIEAGSLRLDAIRAGATGWTPEVEFTRIKPGELVTLLGSHVIATDSRGMTSIKQLVGGQWVEKFRKDAWPTQQKSISGQPQTNYWLNGLYTSSITRGVKAFFTRLVYADGPNAEAEVLAALGSSPPPPPPPPDPEPEPEPTDPCASVKAELAAAITARETAEATVAERDATITEIRGLLSDEIGLLRTKNPRWGWKTIQARPIWQAFKAAGGGN